MYTLVESFGSQLLRAPDGAEFLLPCLVEDEHGIRLLVSVDLIPTSVWQSAATGGAQGVLRVTRQGFFFSTTEQFTRQRVENAFALAFEMAERHWLPVAWGLSYPDLLEAWSERYAAGDDPFAQMHTHTEMSAWDGYQTMDEMCLRLTEMGQHHFAATDHGNCAVHPLAHKTAEEYGLHACFGMEAYFVEDRFNRREGSKYDYWHLILWAQDDEGLKNLWAASTESYRDGFWGYPKLDWDTLTRLNSGLLVSTACLGGPLADPYLKGDEEKALANLARLGDIFGDRLRVEIQTTGLPEQTRVNRWLVDVAASTGVPLVVGVDAHYARREQARDHRVWIAMQSSGDVNDVNEKGLFSAQDYYLHTIHEVRDALAYLPGDVVEKAISETTALAESCTAAIRPRRVTPVYSKPTAEHPDPVQHDSERAWGLVVAGLERRVIGKGIDPAPYLAKVEHEFDMLYRKSFLGYYLITADFVNWAKDRGILVGPGRGSGGASACAWFMGITELDPVKGNLLFDRFMTEGRKSLPDFDIDFPASRTEDVIAYVQERWGHAHVARAGSHIRLKNKGVFKGVQRALQSELPGESFSWVVAINQLIDQAEASTAGLGLSWSALMDAVGDLLTPFREKLPELFRLAEQFHLRLQSYGKHAAGIVIDPEHDLESELPMRLGEEGADGTAPMVTQFDMDALEYLGKIKFDFLSLRNLDTIQVTIDAIAAETGRRIDPYGWNEEYDDPQVYDALSEGWTLGVFQIETPLGTRVTRQLKPRSRIDLANVITIGRPGPLRSGLDKIYLRRRDGIELVTYPDPRLEAVLSDTFAVMLFQEDIMNICTVIGGYTSDEADDVRRILGKKQVEKVETQGHKFVERAVANGTDQLVAVDLWSQMSEFAKYSFGKAHAYGYATIALWSGWLKTHYPRQSLTSSMATIKKERIPQFVGESRRLGYEVLPPDVNISKRGFAAHDLQIRYGFESLSGIAGAGATALIQGQPYASYEDFLARQSNPEVMGDVKPANMGIVKKLVAVGAFDSLHPNRRALEASVIDVTSGESDRCLLFDQGFANRHNDLPCRFDWDSEPRRYGRPHPKTGERKLLKIQPVPPLTCRRKACRQYVPKEKTDFSHLPNYTPEQIREREVEMLGVFLTSSPFDVVSPEMMADLYTADDLAVAENGIYPAVAVVLKSRPDAKGRDFGFADLLTPSGDLSVIMWSRDYQSFRPQMRKGVLAFVRIIKSADDRYRLDQFLAL